VGCNGAGGLLNSRDGAMRAILADQNVEGHVAALVRILQQEPWRDFWVALNLSVFTFADLGLLRNVADS
jgi:hypothetical protein